MQHTLYHKACTKHFPALLCTTPMQHSCSHYNAFCNITWQTRMYLCTWQHKMTTIMQAVQCNLQPEIPQTHRTTHTHKHTQRSLKPQLQCNKKNIRTNVPATASHTSCPSSLPAATLHGKTPGFVLQLPPQHKPPTFMQPFHCEFLQHSCNPFASLWLPYHFPTTSLRHHFPSSPLPLVTTLPSDHFPMYRYVMQSLTPPPCVMNFYAV